MAILKGPKTVLPEGIICTFEPKNNKPVDFEAANILQNSLFLSSLLSNSETWYNLTKKEITELESVNEILFS